MGKTYDLIVIGDAMVDVTVKAPRGRPGGAYPSRIVLSPGGLANVAVAASVSGARTGFVGVVGNDCFGDLYRSDLERQGVASFLSRCEAPTGICTNFISPEGERTMYTSRGANDCLSVSAIPKGLLGSCRMVFLSGFSLENPNSAKAMQVIAEKAKTSGAQVAFGAGSFNILEEHGQSFSRLVHGYGDVLVLNRTEALALAGLGELESAFDVLKKLINVLVITLGRKGSLGCFEGRVVHIPSSQGKTVDTTGAGDAFTGAFLAGILKGRGPEESMKEASQLAAHSVSLLGPRGISPKPKGSETAGR